MKTTSEKKAALYVRVSTQYQIDKDSLPMQKEDLINYSKYALGIDKYEIFEDAGYSAKNTDRPAFQRMMARLRTGEFTHLCVWKIDRISRNLLDFAGMYAEIKNLGVTFVSKNEQFDTSNAMGEAMLKIILVFAELERNMTSERVSAVMVARATNGEWNGGRIPFGYDYDKQAKLFSINEEEAAIVRLIYEMYASGKSLLSISRELNEKGIATKRRNHWNPTTIDIILKNPFYTGRYRYNRHDERATGNSHPSHIKPEEEWILAEEHHPAIIDDSLQEMVVAKLQEKRRGNKDSSKTYERKNTHIFAGLLYCGYCNLQMQATIDRARKGGYRPSIYACTRKRRFSDCQNKYISDVVVGPFVFNYIANILKAQNNFGKSTTVEAFEKKLLRGTPFMEIASIERAGLEDMYSVLKSDSESSDVFSSPTANIAKKIDETIDERNLLASEKRKKERALERLKSLYLYSEDAMSETEFLVSSKSLTEQISEINKRLEELEKESSTHFSMSDKEFLQKASLFIMTHELKEKRFINFVSMIHKIDPKIVKDFVKSIIQKIVIKDGRIISIRFKNGIEHKFLYKE